MAEIFEDDGLFAAEEERKRQEALAAAAQEQARLDAERQYESPMPAADRGIYATVQQQAGYAGYEEQTPGWEEPAYQDSGYEEATPTYGGYEQPAYADNGDTNWPEQSTSPAWYDGQGAVDPYVDPFAGYVGEFGGNDPGQAIPWYDRAGAAYELETGSNRMYDQVLEGRFENEIDPFRSWTDQQGNQYQWDPAARYQQLPDMLDFENPALAPYKDPTTYAAWQQEQRNAWYTDQVQGDVDQTLWAGIQDQQARQQGYNQVWQGRADKREADQQAAQWGSYVDDLERTRGEVGTSPWLAQQRREADPRTNPILAQELRDRQDPFQQYQGAGIMYGQGVAHEQARFERLAAEFQEVNQRGGLDQWKRTNGLTEREIYLLGQYGGVAGFNDEQANGFLEQWLSMHGLDPRTGTGTVSPNPIGGKGTVDQIMQTMQVSQLAGLVTVDRLLQIAQEAVGGQQASRGYTQDGPAVTAYNKFGEGYQEAMYGVALGLAYANKGTREQIRGASTPEEQAQVLLSDPMTNFVIDLAIQMVGGVALHGAGGKLAGLRDIGVIDTRGIGATVDNALPSAPSVNQRGVPNALGTVSPVRGVDNGVVLGGGGPPLRPGADPRARGGSVGPVASGQEPVRAVAAAPGRPPEVATGRPRVADRPVNPYEAETQFYDQPEQPAPVAARPVGGYEAPPQARQAVPPPREPSVAPTPDYGVSAGMPAEPRRAADPAVGPKNQPQGRPAGGFGFDKPLTGGKSDLSEPELVADFKLLLGDTVRQSRSRGGTVAERGARNKALARDFNEFVDAVKNGDEPRMRRGVERLPEETVRDILGLLEERGYDVSRFELHPAVDRVQLERDWQEGASPGFREKEQAQERFADKETRENQMGGVYRNQRFQNTPEQVAFGTARRDMTLAGDLPEPPVLPRAGAATSVNEPWTKPRVGREASPEVRAVDPDYRGTSMDPTYDGPDYRDRPAAAPSTKVGWDPKGTKKGDGVYEATQERVQRLTGREYPDRESLVDAHGRAKIRYERLSKELEADRKPMRLIIERAEELGIWEGGSVKDGGKWQAGLLKEMSALADKAYAAKDWSAFRGYKEARQALSDERRIFKDGAQGRLNEVAEAARDYNVLSDRLGTAEYGRPYGAAEQAVRPVSKLEQGRRLRAGRKGIGQENVQNQLPPSAYRPRDVGPDAPADMRLVRESPLKDLVPSKESALRRSDEGHSFDSAREPELGDTPDTFDEVRLGLPDSARTWLKQNAGGFALAAPAATAAETDEDDPNRGLKLLAAAGLGGIGVSWGAKNYRANVKAGARYALPGGKDTPIGRKFWRLDTQRNSAATIVGEDLRDRLAQGDLVIGPHMKPRDQAKTIKALQGYANHGYFPDMLRPMTEASVLRDTQVRNALDLVGKEIHAKIPFAVRTMPDEAAFQAYMTSVADEALKAHIGVSKRGPLVSIPEKIHAFSTAMVLKTNPGWAVKNLGDGGVQVLGAKGLGQLGMQRAGKSKEIADLALKAERSGLFPVAWVDAQVVQDIAPTERWWDRYNPVLAGVTKGEVKAKTSIYRTHVDNYFTTAMAKELGVEDRFMSVTKYLNANNPTAKIAGKRLEGLPAALKADLAGMKDLTEIRARLKREGLPVAERERILSIVNSHQRDARDYSRSVSQVQMRNYADRSNLDVALSVVYPFHYWQTRGTVWNAHLAARYPVAAAAVAAAAVWTLDDNKDLPLSDKLNANLPVRKMVEKMPMPAGVKEQVLEGLDWYRDTHNAGDELKFGLLDWTAPNALSAIKGADPANLKNLVDITDPVNMALAAERLFGWKGRSVAWGISEAVMRQREGSPPDWLKEALEAGDGMYSPVEKDRYFPSVAGGAGRVARGAAEKIGAGGIPEGVNEALYGKARSKGEDAAIYAIGKQGKLSPEEARKAYYERGAASGAVSLLGLPSRGGKPVARGDEPLAPRTTTGQRFDDAPGPYDYDNAPKADSDEPNERLPQDPEDKAAQAAFVKAHGKPPADGTPEATAYWKLWGEQVGHYTPRDTTAQDQKKRSTETIQRVMAEYAGRENDPAAMTEAWTKIKEQQYAWGLPVTNMPNIGLKAEQDSETVRDNLAQIRSTAPDEAGDKRDGAAWTRERVADLNDWVDREAARTKQTKDKVRSQPVEWLNGLTPYEWQVKYDPTYDPMKYVQTGPEHQPGTKGMGGGVYAGIRAGAGLAQSELAEQAGGIWDTYFKMQVEQGKSKASAWLNAPYGTSGKTRAEFANGYKKDQGLNLTGPGKVATATSTPTPPASGTSSATPGASTASSGAKPTYAATTRQPMPASTARYAPTAPRAASTPSRAASSSTTISKYPSSGATVVKPSTTNGKPVSPFQSWLDKEKPQLAARVAGAETPATRAGEPGASAKDTAQAWTKWEELQKGGRATVADAVPLLEAHVAGGGNPAAYVRRAKNAVYELVRAYQGATRQAGDKQRGQWFAAIKALPEDAAGLRALAKLEAQVVGQTPRVAAAAATRGV